LRVLYVIDDLGAAGAERSLAVMVAPYVRRGIELDVACLFDRPGIHAELEADGATVFCVDGPGGRTGRIRRARRLIVKRRPDLVHTTLFEADLAGRVAAAAAGVPVVSSLVNSAYGLDQAAAPGIRAWKLRAAQLLDALTARRVVRFHAISSHVADLMVAKLRLPRDRVDVIPRGRDPRRLGTRDASRRAGARLALGVADGVPLVVAAARQEYQKGLDVLIEAFATVHGSLPAARLVIAGRDGNQTTSLRAAAAQLEQGGVVRFLGARSDLPDLLCAADVFVVSSRWEGLGSVLLEAMALQAPIVASDLPPIREVVSDGVHARLSAPGDSNALADALLTELLDPLGSAARAAAAHERFLACFTAERVADQMAGFYQRALAAAGRGAAARMRA
jgi:glycosyltransferase involved in cell wall biosynthesis